MEESGMGQNLVPLNFNLRKNKVQFQICTYYYIRKTRNFYSYSNIHDIEFIANSNIMNWEAINLGGHSDLHLISNHYTEIKRIMMISYILI